MYMYVLRGKLLHKCALDKKMPTGKAPSTAKDEARRPTRRTRENGIAIARLGEAKAQITRGKDVRKRGGVRGKSMPERQGNPAPRGGGGDKKKRASFRGQSQSCHQCRQSIHSNKGVSEVKSGRDRLKCSTCTRFWCEQCLLNRYGIVKATVAVEMWVCPVCSKRCNCSLCRRKEGKLATGILTPLAKVAGFGSVSDFLSDGTDDIARILQWQSPRQPSSGSSKGESRSGNVSKRSRKRQREIDTPLTPTPPPSPLSSRTHSASGDRVSCEGRTDQPSGDINCHGNRPKRLQLQSLKISSDTSKHMSSVNGGCTETIEGGPIFHVPMTPSDDPASDRSSSSLNSPPLPITSSSSPLSSTTTEMSSSSKNTSVHQHCNEIAWKSPRQRSAPQRFTSADFRESKGQRGAKGRRNSSQGARGPSDRIQCCEERETKKEELESLRKKQLDSLRCNQKQLEQEERLKESERRKQERQKKAELQRLAKEIARESHESEKRGRSPTIRDRRVEELTKLKQERMEWRRQLKDMSFLLTSSPALLTEDDSPEACNEQGVPPLPDIPPLVLPIATQLVPQLLSVAEFLTTFSECIKLRCKPSADTLAMKLSSDDGPVNTYQKLLQFVVPQDNEMRSKFKGRGQRWEKLAAEYLNSLGKAVKVSGVEVKSGDDVTMTSSPEYRLALLELLTDDALGKSAIVDVMEVAMMAAGQARQEGRRKTRARTKSISNDLRGLGTVGDIELKKTEIMEELALIQRHVHDKQYSSRLLLRNSCLGEDRLGRKYWRFQCVPGVVVEQRIIDGCYGDGGFQDSNVEYFHINNESLLTTFMTCLHSSGNREGALLSHLHNLQPTITSSLLTPHH